MPRKKYSRRNNAAPQQGTLPAVMPLDPTLMGPINPMLVERSLRRISRFMQSDEFASLEEAEERLQEMLDEPLDELLNGGMDLPIVP